MNRVAGRAHSLHTFELVVLGRMMLEGLREHQPKAPAPLEMLATVVTWAIYGATQEWAREPGRCTSEEMAETIVMLVSPILGRTPPNEREGATWEVLTQGRTWAQKTALLSLLSGGRFRVLTRDAVHAGQ